MASKQAQKTKVGSSGQQFTVEEVSEVLFHQSESDITDNDLLSSDEEEEAISQGIDASLRLPRLETALSLPL
ncbi:hypothetical protein AOXY_G8628 [Acipenser oxyrinchus oxyrinchus]|uniref:Uncharacterized protein n=1 Tax=Acipenser oxyrinchus oxyrinchus TaxID=40147 RepID=A0AAD8G8M0_ACIOX|nr:hypothetical protein AOXY_G8628 [Acipenser oxyrinchus oxyrinchus]